MAIAREPFYSPAFILFPFFFFFFFLCVPMFTTEPRHEISSHRWVDMNTRATTDKTFFRISFCYRPYLWKKTWMVTKPFPPPPFFSLSFFFFFFYLKDRKFVFFFFLRADEDRVCTRRPSFAHVSSSTFSFFLAGKKATRPPAEREKELGRTADVWNDNNSANGKRERKAGRHPGKNSMNQDEEWLTFR